MEIIGSIKYVDLVVPQHNMNKEEAWDKLKFDIMFVGDDWYDTPKWNEIEERLKAKGVKIIYFPYTKGVSSTLINDTLKKIKKIMRILRVSSHPTKNFHGIGLHPHKISSTKRFKTFFSTFKISKQEEIIEVSNYDVFISDIYFDKRPTEGNKFKIIFFYLNRIIKLLRFSFRSIF